MGLCNSKLRNGVGKEFEPFNRTLSKLEYADYSRKDTKFPLKAGEIKDFFAIHEKNLLVLLTGDWYKSEFSFQNTISIPSKEIFTPIFKNPLQDSVECLPQAFFSEVQKESSAPPQITLLSLKTRKPIKIYSGFSKGLSWYANCHYSQCLKGLLLLELSLDLYLFFMNGKNLSKVVFPNEASVDLRAYEVVDSLGFLITSSTDFSIDIYSTTSERTQKCVSQEKRFIYLDLHQKIKMRFSEPVSRVSNLSYCCQLQLICAISDQNELNYFCWNSGEKSFGQIELEATEKATETRPLNTYRKRSVATNFFKRFDYVAGRKKLWTFVEGKCLYIWHTDFSQTEIYDISNFAQKQEIKLITTVNWGSFMEPRASFGWDSIFGALKKIHDTNHRDAKALIILSRLYTNYRGYENILNDCICKENGDFVLVSLLQDSENPGSVCQIMSAAKM